MHSSYSTTLFVTISVFQLFILHFHEYVSIHTSHFTFLMNTSRSTHLTYNISHYNISIPVSHSTISISIHPILHSVRMIIIAPRTCPWVLRPPHQQLYQCTATNCQLNVHVPPWMFGEFKSGCIDLQSIFLNLHFPRRLILYLW